MKTLRALVELMKADIRERTRSYSFLVTVAATLYLGYLVKDGTIGVHLGNCLPAPNSAWTGMVMALCTVTFVGLVGFYVVKNAIERDRLTGVGQILAATPLSKTLYILGKLLSNFAVLAIVTGILAAAAVLLQAFRGQDLNIAALLSPFLLLTMPAMFFVSGLAVFFESVKLLRGGFGNVLFFFAYTGFIVLPMETGMMSADIFGMKLAIGTIEADVRLVVPDYDGNFTVGMAANESRNPVPMVWSGLPWTAERIGYRAMPVVYGFVLALIAAGLFDRFSTGGAAGRSGRFRKLLNTVTASPLQRIPGWILLPFDALLGRFAAGRIFVAELRLMLQGLPWWWYAAALGLWIASVTSDITSARTGLLPFLMIWPVLMWSGMGTREKRFRTGSILFSAPRPLARQVPATWGAGFAVAMIFESGILFRLAMTGNPAGVLAVTCGAAFVSSFALALGVWSGTSKTFEACYVAFWYIGPAHHTTSIDFLATTDAAVAAGTPLVFAAAACVLFVAALVGRRRQIISA